MDPSDPLVMRPARGAAAGWAVASGVLIAAGVWLVVDSDGAALSWVAVAGFVLVGSYFLLQAAAPSWFTIVCDADGIRGRNLWHRVAADWRAVRHVELDRFAGDPLLRLRVDHDGRLHTVELLLPVGADPGRLEDALRHRRTRADDHADGPDRRLRRTP